MSQKYLTRPVLPNISPLLKRGKLEEACILLEEALEEDPEDLDIYVLLVPCLLDLGNTARADWASLRMLGMGDEDVRAYYTRALYLLEIGQPRIGNYHISKAARLNPENPDVLALQAAYALAANDIERAQYLAESALELDPQHAQALATQLLVLRKTDFPKVESKQKAIPAIDPSDDNVKAGWNYLHLHEYEKAKKLFSGVAVTHQDYEQAQAGLLEAVRRGWKPYQKLQQAMKFLGHQPQIVYWIVALTLGIVIQILSRWGAPTIIWLLPAFLLLLLLSLWIAEPLGHFILWFHPMGRKTMDKLSIRSGFLSGFPMILGVLALVIAPTYSAGLTVALTLVAVGITAGMCFMQGKQPDPILRGLFYLLLAAAVLYLAALVVFPLASSSLSIVVGSLFMGFQLLFAWKGKA